MGTGGKNRDWGYASYDVDDPDKLGYTSYEKSGSVNKYYENEDGGHGHDYHSDQNSYNMGNEPDYSRPESNGSLNPSTGEVQNNGGCYLTTACLKWQSDKFDDNCEELRLLRWFRDNYVDKGDICYYYDIAPKIVKSIDSASDSDEIYKKIYENVVLVCVKLIKLGKFKAAYGRYKDSVVALENKYLN